MAETPLTFSSPVLFLLSAPASLSAFLLPATVPRLGITAILTGCRPALPFDPALPASGALLAARPRDEARLLTRQAGHGRAFQPVARHVSVL